MKKLTLLLLVIFLMNILSPIGTVFAETAPAMPTDYIAAWDFETETGGKITDLSVNGYHGAIRKPAFMTRSAVEGFNNSYGLVLSTTAETDTQMNAPGLGNLIKTKSAVSVSGWFKNNGDFSKERYMFNIPNTAGNIGLGGSITTDKKLKLQLRNPGGSLPSVTTASTPTTVGEWFHYTFIAQLPSTSSGKATLIIYVNGVEAAKSTNIDVGGMTTFTTLGHVDVKLDKDIDFRLGGNGSSMFIGALDDVKVYDRVLTQSEITALAYNPNVLPDPEPAAPALIAKYDFEQLTAGNEVVDTSGKGFNGTFASQYIGIDTGYRGKGAHALAKNDTYMYSEEIMPAINYSRAITVAGWFNNDVLTSGSDFNFFNFLIDGNTLGFKANINKVAGDSNDRKIVISARSVSTDSWLNYAIPVVWDKTNEWHHFVFIVDYENSGYTNGYLGVFIDGVEYSTNNIAFKKKYFNLGTPVAHSARFGGGGTATFQGSMDELRVYNYRIGLSEINALATDVRKATTVTSLKIGGNECINLPNARVTNADDEFGGALAGNQPLTGITYSIENNAQPEVTVKLNDADVSDLSGVQVKPGDTVLFQVKGDDWEGKITYKITLGERKYESTKIHGFNKYGFETEYLHEGRMTFNTKVKNNSADSNFLMIAAIYSKENNQLLNIEISKTAINSGEIGNLECSIDIPENYNEINFKIFIWSESNEPVISPKVYTIAPAEVTELTMPSIFGSHSVIQRDAPIEVWGKAVPHDEVTVSFAGSEQTVTADFKGDFKAVLPAKSANSTGQTMTISTREKTITYDDILIGDVWLCGGQSNMRWSLNTTSNAAADKADADNYPTIRLFDQQNSENKLPQFDVVGGGWAVCSSATAEKFSGVGYLFGRELSKSLADVPIGLISASYGGSRAEAWMSMEAIESDSRFKALDSRLSSTDLRRPTYLYNSMLKPLAPYGIKGVIFYQGEGNAYDAPLYKDIFIALVDDWRKSWNNENLPFIYAQIAAYDTPYASEDRPGVRQSQLEALDLIANSAMVVTMDIGEKDNQHPENKTVVAERMVLAARGLAYGENINYKSPSVESVAYGTDTAVIKFKDVANGLDTTKALSEFTLVDAHGTEYPATAVFQGSDTIAVTAEGITEIAQIKYAYSNFPENGVTIWSNCDNGIQLPASPFRIVRGQ